MNAGHRVKDKHSPRQGVVLRTQFGGSAQESHVLWDSGETSWEMSEDLSRLPNVSGDAFKAMNNGFGLRPDETSPKQEERSNFNSRVEAMIAFGFFTPPRKGPNVSPPPPKPGDQQIALALAAATGEPMLVGRGNLAKQMPRHKAAWQNNSQPGRMLTRAERKALKRKNKKGVRK